MKEVNAIYLVATSKDTRHKESASDFSETCLLSESIIMLAFIFIDPSHQAEKEATCTICFLFLPTSPKTLDRQHWVVAL